MAELLYPTDGYRGSLSRRGIKPKDHSKTNRVSLKDLQSTIQEKLNRPPATPSLWKSKKFEAVASRVFNRPVSAPPPKEQDSLNFRDLKPDFGKVPEYLAQIKTELEAKRAHKAALNAQENWPQGKRLLQDSERLEHLKRLKEEREAVWRDLNSLPFTSDTLAVKRRRSQLELRLKELEVASGRFSVARVFVDAS
jgi:hypothetical protein